jgi:preprotein translocase subunit YajC
VKKIMVLLLTISTVPSVWADAPAGAAPASSPMSGLLGMAPWIGIFAIFYFLLIRPQQKQAKEQQKMIDNIKRGDRILTNGGIYATVHAVKGKVLEVKLTEEVKVLMTKSAVSQVVAGDPAQEAESAEQTVKN